MPCLTIILCGDTRREMEEWITALRNVTLRNQSNVSWVAHEYNFIIRIFKFCPN